MARRLAVRIVWITLAATACGGEDQATPRSRVGSSAEQSALIAQAALALQAVAAAQEVSRSATGTYASGLAELGQQMPSGVTVVIRSADAGGWAGTAVHERVPGSSCVIYVGPAQPQTTLGGRRPAGPGMVECDEPAR